jgi:hypothetical protein
MRAEYKEKAGVLVSWVDGKITELSKHDFDNTLEGVQALMKEFYSYKVSLAINFVDVLSFG